MFYHEFVKNRTSISGLYRITNTLNGKFYIGKAEDIFKRWRKHVKNDKRFAIHHAIAKYGVEVFNFEILVKCLDTLYLTTLEENAIRAYDCVAPNGYNLTYGGEGGKQILECAITKAKHTAAVQSPEFRKKTSENSIAMWADPEFKAKRVAQINEISDTPEFRAKISKTSKAMWADPEYVAARLAQVRSLENRTAFAEISKANWSDPVTRAKLLDRNHTCFWCGHTSTKGHHNQAHGVRCPEAPWNVFIPEMDGLDWLMKYSRAYD